MSNINLRNINCISILFIVSYWNITDTDVQQPHQEAGGGLSDGRNTAVRDFFTMLALSVHAVFEGLAIGLEPDSDGVWILYGGKRGFWTFQYEGDL